MAKMGAKADLKGIKYSQEKSVKKFLGDRKRSIGNLNVEGDVERESQGKYQPPVADAQSHRQSVSLPPISKEPLQDKETVTSNLLEKLRER